MTLLLLVSIGALLLIWVAYPLAIAALAALRASRATARASATPRVSVIIASAETAAAIRARVANIIEARYSPDRFDVVVALDYSSARATVEDLDDLDPRVTVVRGDAPGGKACALNAAVRASRSDVLVFTDTAQSFDDHAVSELVEVLGDSRVAAASGLLELERGARGGTLAHLYWRYERWLRAAEARLDSSVGVTGAIYAMRRDCWKPLPAGLILDDVYTPMRLAIDGWRIGFTTKAIAYDERKLTPAQEYRRKVRTLTGVIQLCAWLPVVLNPVRNPIWIQFVFHKLLRLLTPYLAFASLFASAWMIGGHVIRSGQMSVVFGAGAAIVLTMIVPRVRRAVTTQLAWAWALQTSAVTASVNGLRGNWDVWKREP